MLYCKHGVKGSFKLSYHSPSVTVPILSCGYGRGRELRAIWPVEASQRRTDRQGVVVQCDTTVFLIRYGSFGFPSKTGLLTMWTTYPVSLPLVVNVFWGWRRSAGWRAGWKALSNCLSRFSWAIPGAPLLLNYFPRNLLTEMKTG